MVADFSDGSQRNSTPHLKPRLILSLPGEHTAPFYVKAQTTSMGGMARQAEGWQVKPHEE